MTPDKAPIKYTVNNILTFSLTFLFILNSTSKATPLPVSNPAITEANDITLFKYNSVNITLAPQFGIKPIKLDINGLKKLSFKNNFSMLSFPK